VIKPAVGTVVHYVSYGTPNGEFPKTCRAAIVTETGGEYVDGLGNRVELVGLAAINPTGVFFHTVAEGGCRYDETDRPSGGTWHHVHP